MNGSRLQRTRGRKKAPPRGDQCLFFRCDDWVVAIPTSYVQRLVFPDEVRRRPLPDVPEASILELGERRYVGWDLGELVGREPLGRAWVLLRLQHRGIALDLALGTGTCLSVAAVPDVTSLPPGLFLDRSGAFAGAYPVQGNIGRFDALVGLRLDPDRLWTPAELDAAALALSTGAGSDEHAR